MAPQLGHVHKSPLVIREPHSVHSLSPMEEKRTARWCQISVAVPTVERLL